MTAGHRLAIVEREDSKEELVYAPDDGEIGERANILLLVM